MATPINQAPAPPSGQSSSLKWILIGCGVLAVLGGIFLVAAAGLFMYMRAPEGGTSSRRPSLFGGSDVRLVEDHGIETVQKTWSSCTAYAPADWTIVGNEQRTGMAVDLAAPDQSMAA